MLTIQGAEARFDPLGQEDWVEMARVIGQPQSGSHGLDFGHDLHIGHAPAVGVLVSLHSSHLAGVVGAADHGLTSHYPGRRHRVGGRDGSRCMEERGQMSTGPIGVLRQRRQHVGSRPIGRH